MINENGNLELFTRGVDVANISQILNIGASTECQQDTYYDIAEATWRNMQEEIADWMNNPMFQGQAEIVPSTAVRVDRDQIEALLISEQIIIIDQIPSNCD